MWSKTTRSHDDRLALSPTFRVCSTCAVATVPEEVSRYLHAVTALVRDDFGADVVGVYTTGSGDYRPGRSDIDLMAVVAGSPDLDLRRQLVPQLDHRVLTGPAAGLEFVLYPLTTVNRPMLDAGYLINSNTGSALPSMASFDPGRCRRANPANCRRVRTAHFRRDRFLRCWPAGGRDRRSIRRTGVPHRRAGATAISPAA
jgi:hypothetical protein